MSRPTLFLSECSCWIRSRVRCNMQGVTSDNTLWHAPETTGQRTLVLSASTTMTRTNVWYSSSRVLEDKWKIERQQQHRARLEVIHAAPSHSGKSTAQLSPACPQHGTNKKAFKALPKSKSPAAKYRQAEIERENLKMIKKIVELQRDKRLNKSNPSKRGSRTCDVNCKRVPEYSPNFLSGLAPGGGLGVPRASSHPLYTHHAATMTHHFPEQNDIALNFTPGSKSTIHARHRAQVQILHENRKLLQRILTSKTTFSRSSWQAQEQERRKLLNNISRFSHLPKRHSSPSGSFTPQRPQSALHRTAVNCPLDSHTKFKQEVAFSDDDSDEGLLEQSTVICAGSPVSHLRHRRPLSASAAGSRRQDTTHGCLSSPVDRSVRSFMPPQCLNSTGTDDAQVDKMAALNIQDEEDEDSALDDANRKRHELAEELGYTLSGSSDADVETEVDDDLIEREEE